MANTITVWSQFYITDAGLRLRQQTIATGAELTFCFARIGQGVPSNRENIPLMTDIVLYAEEVPVIRTVADGSSHYVGVRVDNKDFEQSILMTEIGLYAKIGDDEPVLYGYAYATQGYDSIPAGNVSHFVWTIGIDTIISRSQNITFAYDGSKVYASEEEIDELIKAFDEFKNEIRNDIISGKFLEIANEELARHNSDENAHSNLLAKPVSFSIEIDGWTQLDESFIGCKYCAEVTDENTSSTDFPDVYFDTNSIESAAESAIMVVSDVAKIIFYAESIPSVTLSGTYFVRKGVVE